MKIVKYVLAALLLFASVSFSQTYTVTGNVTDAETGEALVGANVYVKDAMVGAAADIDGNYSFRIPAGEYTIVCSYVGYEAKENDVTINADTEIDFQLAYYHLSRSILIIADRAKERETPVAFSNLSKKDLDLQLGSRDIPLVLNTTPSVYATESGGGAGDSRVNIRGFDQRNIAIMINGVPINDMENGWVYWSNWDGIADATSSIQVQRGLSAVNLSTPSVGGTMNVVTDPAAKKLGFGLKQEFGNAGYLKTTLFGHSGIVWDKWAFSGAVVKKTGDGIIDKTWMDSYAYYFGTSFNASDDHKFELFALGAPQRHGQNLYKQNIATYDKEFALSLDDYNPRAIYSPDDSVGVFIEQGRKYNQTWNSVEPSYTGQQNWNESTHDRYGEDFINERENFFHKPLVNLNWYANLSKLFSLFTTVYYSGGVGGGTGTYENRIRSSSTRTTGAFIWDYSYSPSRRADWDANIEMNRDIVDRRGNPKAPDQSVAILRNSRNNQWTIGALSKGYMQFSKEFKAIVGVDWRTAEIEHYYEIRDLLGGNYYYDYFLEYNAAANKFDTTLINQFRDPFTQLKLGDKVLYYNTNTVDWLGFYGQGEYSADKVTLYGMFGWSTIKYSYTDHFRTAKTLANGAPDVNSGEFKLKSDNISGFQLKGGLSYRATDQLTVYGNGGYISKVPIFDAVINDNDGSMIENPENEKIMSFEAGAEFTTLNNNLKVRANGYYTNWTDRVITRNDFTLNDEEGLVVVTGMDARHVGGELEISYQPITQLRLTGIVSVGNWVNTNAPPAHFKSYESNFESYYTLYLKDLKVGDQPQTTLAFGSTTFIEGFTGTVLFRYYMEHYAQWNPINRNDETDREQSWKAPSYGVVDLHATYDLPFKLGDVGFQLFAHVFNLLDEVYILDAVDNSDYSGWDYQYPAYSGIQPFDSSEHDADDAEVYLGLPRYINFGLRIAM